MKLKFYIFLLQIRIYEVQSFAWVICVLVETLRWRKRSKRIQTGEGVIEVA